MRKLLLLLALTLLGNMLFAQQLSGTADEKQILEKCLSLPELQQYLPKNSNNSLKGLKIMQHVISFPGDMNVTVDGNTVELIGKGLAMSGTIEAYFLFQQFSIKENECWIEVVLYYEQNTSTPKRQVVNLKLNKASTWTITETKIQGGQS